MINLRLLTIAVAVLILGGGIFTLAFADNDSDRRNWTVNSAHALIWNGTPYLPFAITYEPQYFVEQTEENFEADQMEIAAFKISGVKDVVIKASKGITNVPAEAIQKIIDLLEQNDLFYGFDLYSPPYTPISGYIIEPTVYRVDDIRESRDIIRNFPSAKSALYAVCSATTGEVMSTGRRAVMNGEVTIPVHVRTGEPHVLLIYPEEAIAETGLFDVWGDFDRYRDRLISHISKLEFGEGLRFFLDPFSESFGIEDEMENLVPTAPAFRFEFAAWLARNYGSLSELNQAWSILKHNVTSFDEAARMIPLWQSGRGAPAVFDDGIEKSYPVDASQSKIWADLREFRSSSIRSYMDSAADVIKRTTADVPVIFTANSMHRIFQADGSIGYDGLMVPSGGEIALSAGEVFSMAHNSMRGVCMFARISPGESYGSKADFFAVMNQVRDLGVKGFIVDVSDIPMIEGANLLTWLAEYASASAEDVHFASYLAEVLYYPIGVDHASARKLSGGQWWLPALMPGSNLYLGENLAGYYIPKHDTIMADVFIWSLTGNRKVTLVSGDPINVISTSGEEVEFKPNRRNRVEFTIDDEPVLVKGLPPGAFLPVEVVQEAIEELKSVIERGGLLRMEVSDYEKRVKTAQDMLNDNKLGLSLSFIQETLAELTHRMRGLENSPVQQ